MACMRLVACCQMTLRGPSTTAPVISSPRWAGRQWSTTASALAPAALKLGGAAANAQSALSPANIHNTAVAGTKQAVARK